MLDSIYHMTLRIHWNLISAVKHNFLSLCTLDVVMDVMFTKNL